MSGKSVQPVKGIKRQQSIIQTKLLDADGRALGSVSDRANDMDGGFRWHKRKSERSTIETSMASRNRGSPLRHIRFIDPTCPTDESKQTDGAKNSGKTTLPQSICPMPAKVMRLLRVRRNLGKK
jgi:hypothetical protein